MSEQKANAGRREALGLMAGATAAAAIGGLARGQATSPIHLEAEVDTAESLGWNEAKKEYVLPDLPYRADALEPHIDEETMTLHHDKHHATYVGGLNRAIASLAKLRETKVEDDEIRTRAALRDMAFHGSGHMLHCMFWTSMAAPKEAGGGEPRGALMDAIKRDFGSFKKFSEQFQTAGQSVQGSGWALLVAEPASKRLLIMEAEKHQDVTIWGVRPLLMVDVWEHAYYVKYRNRKRDYLAAWMNVINWETAARRFEAAMG